MSADRFVTALSLVFLTAACDKQSTPAAAEATAASAQEPVTAKQEPGSAPSGAHRGPPAEAFEACSGKKADDACTVKRGDHEMAGKCGSPPDGDSDTRLVCRPDGGHGGPGGHRGPPPDGSGGHGHGSPEK
jgi:hypothetical protein